MGAADSKLVFKKSVFRLFEDRNIPTTADDYWEQFWTLPEGADDVFSLVSSSDIRRVRDHARENLESLVEKALCRLFDLAENPTFPSPTAPASQALNCIRILTRVCPFIYEAPDIKEWEEHYFWSTMASAEPSTASMASAHLSDPTSEIQPEIQQEDEPKQEDGALPITRGKKLLQTLINLLFTSGFTIREALDRKSQVSYVIWESGVGSSSAMGSTKELDNNRIEVLRLLLMLFSKTMYITGSALASTENRWISTVVTDMDRIATLAVLCSLLNTAVKYNPSGWGMPYNHMVFNDQREQLVMICLQVLLVLLAYNVPSSPKSISTVTTTTGVSSSHGARSSPPLETSSTSGSNDRSSTSTSTTFAASGTLSSSSSSGTTAATSSSSLSLSNQYQYYLSRLHRQQDFEFMMDGMYRILSNPMAASSTYLPGSTKQVKCHHEMLMLCWKILEVNRRFRTYILETHRVLDVVIILLYFALENRSDPSQLGMVRMCVCMLQMISGDRALGSCLNKTFEGHSSLPASVRLSNFHGTYGDYLICSVYQLIATTKRTLHSLYPALIATLSNVSPYLKRISPTASNRLLQLVTSFAAPSFLLAEEKNHELLEQVLDTVFFALYHQATENPSLVYAVIQQERKLSALSGLTLQGALDDIGLQKSRRRQKQVQQQAAAAAAAAVAAEQQQQQQRSPRDRPSRGGSRRSSQVATATPGSLNNGGEGLDLSAMNISETPTATRPSMHSRPESTDSVRTLQSDGTGHDGDVEEDEAASGRDPLLMLRRPSRNSISSNNTQANRLFQDGLSERARGKLPEGTSAAAAATFAQQQRQQQQQQQQRSREGSVRESISEPRTSDVFIRQDYSSGTEKIVVTAEDIGKDGFVASQEWIDTWKSSKVDQVLDPLLAVVRQLVPEIERLNATNDHQVLDFIVRDQVAKVRELLLSGSNNSGASNTETTPTPARATDSSLSPIQSQPPALPSHGSTTTHPKGFKIHKFIWTVDLITWFQGMMWAQIYVNSITKSSLTHGIGSISGTIGVGNHNNSSSTGGVGIWNGTNVKLFGVKAGPAHVGVGNVAAQAASALVAAATGTGAARRMSSSTTTATAARQGQQQQQQQQHHR